MRSLFRLAVKNPFRVWIDCPFFSTTSGGRFRHLKHRSLEGSTSRYSKTPSEAFPSKTCRACCRSLGMSSGMSVQAMSVGTSVARRTSLPVKTSVTMSLTRHWMISPDFKTAPFPSHSFQDYLAALVSGLAHFGPHRFVLYMGQGVVLGRGPGNRRSQRGPRQGRAAGGLTRGQ